MANLRGFNANNVDPTTEFEPVPSGKYLAVIIDSEEKPNKAGTGTYLQHDTDGVECAKQDIARARQCADR